jgi:excisionase family DNA binding protein
MCMSTHHLEGLEPLISIDELSGYLGVPVKTIYDWRLTGHGPCAIRVGRHLKYAISDVREWLASQRESVPGRAASGE